MKKRMLCLLVMLLTVWAALPALADGYANGFSYTVLNDGTACITRCGLTGDIVIPAQIDGYTVTCLAAQLFYGKYGVTSVSIPATVTYFGDDPTDNGWDYVFSYCDSLTDIRVDAQNPAFCSVDGVLYDKGRTMLINYPCSHPGTEYTVPATVSELCCTAFARCKNLRALHLPNADTRWYTYTFYDTGALTVYYAPGGITGIMVQNYRKNGMTHDQDAFWCAFVEEGGASNGFFRLPKNLQVIGEEAFAGTACETVQVSDACRSVLSRAFANCARLQKLMINNDPNGITFAQDAFSGCGRITRSYFH